MFRCLVECLELSGRRLPLFRLTRSSLQFLTDPNHPSSLRFPVFMGGFKHPGNLRQVDWFQLSAIGYLTN